MDQVRALAERFGVRGSWTRHPHLTLVFLGQTPLEQIGNAEHALRAACQGIGPLDLSIEGIGCFPSMNRPRVVWLGLQGDVAKLMTLQARVASALEGVGEHRESKRFSPHVTVGRIKEPPPASFGNALKGLSSATLISACFTEVHLFRSELSPKGAKYTPLVSVSLEEPA